MFKRGDIYYCDLGPMYMSEQGKFRPVVIIQNDRGNYFSPTTIVAPISTKKAEKYPTHMRISYRGLKQNSVVLFEQIRTVDKSRLCDYIAHMREKDLRRVDEKIAISLGVVKENLK